MEAFNWDQIFNLYNGVVAFLAVFTIIIVKTASNKWKRVAKEGAEFIQAIADGLDPDGPGGKNITKAEGLHIAKEGVQVVAEATWVFFDIPFVGLMRKIFYRIIKKNK